MVSLLLTALVSAAAPDCPRLAPVEFPGRLTDAVADGCATLVLTASQLARVSPEGTIERVVKGRFDVGQLVLDAPRGRLFVVTTVHGDDGVEVLVTARRAADLGLEPSFGAQGVVRFKAPRPRVKPRASAGGAATARARGDGSLALVTRVDAVDGKGSELTSWRVSAAGELDPPTSLASLDGPMVGGNLVFALAPDGRGLVATSRHAAAPDGNAAQLFGLRPDGAPWDAFGEAGRSQAPDISFPIAAQWTDGAWVLTGTHVQSYRIVVSRLTERGRPDADFARAGVLVLPRGDAIEHPRAMVQRPAGGVTVAGVRFWRKEGRLQPTLLTVSASGEAEPARQLELSSAAHLEVAQVWRVPGGRLRGAGFAGKSGTDRASVSFVRELDEGMGALAAPPPPRAPEGPSGPLYRWVEPDGTEGFATSLDEVPAAYRARARPWAP